MTVRTTWLRSGWLVPALLCGQAVLCGPATAHGEVDFQRDVLPILAEHCFRCHGADEAKRESGLRLDRRDGALQGGDSGEAALIPGKTDAGTIIARITSRDPDVIMPPPREKKPLSATQVETLTRWIAEGAKYKQHWAFTPPAKASLPDAAGHPVDALVRARLKQDALDLSPPADAPTLCRRLFLDLVGLPPSPQDVDSFVAAAGSDGKNLPAAIESLADKLLAGERYGERWARVWLDVARYSDSNGFEKDLPREQWAWRDWVIKAINDDMPYDRFLIEQFAGDLLPGASQEQIVATGFLRNGMINEEGAIVPEQFRLEGLFDRMDCLGKAALGLTLQCAQCHTHKFDPIAHTEYYGLFAFLNDTHEAQSWVYAADQRAEIGRIEKGLRDIDDRLKAARPQWQDELAAWEASVLRSQAAFAWKVMTPTQMTSRSGLNHPTRLPDDSVLTLGHPSVNSEIDIVGEPELNGATGLRLEALKHGDLPFGGPGYSKLGTWAVTELEVHTRKPDDKDWVKVTLTNATADFAEPDHRIEEMWARANDPGRNRSVGPVAYMIDGNNQTGFRADRGPGRRNSESVAVVRFESPLSMPAGTKLRVMLRTDHGGDESARVNVMLGRLRLSLTTAPEPAAAPVAYAAILAMNTPAAERTPLQQETVFNAWRAATPEAKPFHDEAEALWKKYPTAGTSVLHLSRTQGVLRRPTHLLDRGTWDRPKQAVEPHVPAVLHPFPADAGADRLAFARWIADRRSPLTARVAVNRVWQNLFGQGLVETSEDFGTRAPMPEHLPVLDWLAVDFMEHGWSQKRLLRTIVSSETWRQSSKASPRLLEVDPKNRLLARAPRFRADAEVVRDIALTASGLIHHQVGGPSVFPPVPQSVLDYNFSKPTYWKPAEDAQRYRRSLYMFRKRSMPDPVLNAFDAPNGDFACARRPRSNTPLAALTSLNETVFVEAAQALAIRVLNEGGPTEADRIDHAFRLCAGRRAKPEEAKAIQAELAAAMERLQKKELRANDIAFSTLTKPATLPADATPNEIAAWTLVARVLLNVDETLTRQ